MTSNSMELLLTGPEKLKEEKKIAREAVREFGDLFDFEIRAREKEHLDYQTKLQEIDLFEQYRDFEETFEYGRGINVSNFGTVLGVYSKNNESRNHHTIYITDKPMWAEDNGEIYTIHGFSKQIGRKGAVALTNFDYSQKNNQEMFHTLTLHELGHLFNNQETKTIDQNGGIIKHGHCTQEDVMNGGSLEEIHQYRQENQTYCADCTEDIKETLENIV